MKLFSEFRLIVSLVILHFGYYTAPKRNVEGEIIRDGIKKIAKYIQMWKIEQEKKGQAKWN